MEKKISIIIPCYEMQGRGIEFLSRAIKSVQKQKYSNYEVIIGDNSKDDKIKDYIKFVGDSQIKYYKNNKLGISANANFCLDKCTGDIIKPVFQDDFLYTDDCLSVLNGAKGKWFIYPRIQFTDKGKGKSEVPFWSPFNIHGFNTISDPTAIAFRKAKDNPRFDENLVMLLDVEFYHKLFLLYGEPVLIDKATVGIYGWSGQAQRGIKLDEVRNSEGFIEDKYGVFCPRNAIFNPQGRIGVYDLSDTTFIIPVCYDSKDRMENFKICLHHLKSNFDTNIIVGEQGSCGMFKFVENEVQYIYFKYKEWHRTRMLNEMTKMANTPYVINIDADVLIPSRQIYEAIRILRRKIDFVYPYDGRFVRLKKSWTSLIAKDVSQVNRFNGVLDDMTWEGKMSFGGAICYNKSSFIRAGMENEYFISHAPEDYERYYRFKKLGFSIRRVRGCLYHLEHFLSDNSKPNHEYGKQNFVEYYKIKDMSPSDLENYVNTWLWIKNV